MPRLEVPLLHRILWTTGDVLVRAELSVDVKDSASHWHHETFRVDSGSEISTMPAHRAKQLGLAMPQKAVPGLVHQPTGLPVRAGFLTFAVPGMGPDEYLIPCFFLGDPDSPAPTHPPALVPRNLLGLSGVIDKLRIFYDGTPVLPHALYGNLVVEKL